MALTYKQVGTLKWVDIPDSKWYYHEIYNNMLCGDIVVFRPQGEWLKSTGKRSEYHAVLTVGPDWVSVASLPKKYLYILEHLKDYVEDLQRNYSETGKYGVEDTPHIF